MKAFDAISRLSKNIATRFSEKKGPITEFFDIGLQMKYELTFLGGTVNWADQ